MTTTTHSITAAIRAALAVLLEPGSVAELRILETKRGTGSGYFADLDLLAAAAATLDGSAPAIYVTVNPIKRDLLARAANRLKFYAKHTTADVDILSRRWFLVDLDPKRAPGISSTNVEHEAALSRGRAIREALTAADWPMPVYADSGNGAHLLWRVDLPNDDASRHVLERCLEALAVRFSDETVAVDLTTFNAARIWKLYGTLACKGDSTPDRPHRRSALLEVPAPAEVVSRELLDNLAALAPAQPEAVGVTPGDRLDVEAWVSEHRLSVVQRGAWNGGCKWILNPCPWNADHTNRAAYIVQHASGAIAAGCQHNGCHGKDWYALRDLVEPGWREVRKKKSRDLKGREKEPATATELLRRADTRPIIRPGQDFVNDRLIYGVSVGSEALLVTSNREAWSVAEAERFIRLPKCGTLPHFFRPQAIDRHLRGEAVTLWPIVERVANLFREHIF